MEFTGISEEFRQFSGNLRRNRVTITRLELSGAVLDIPILNTKILEVFGGILAYLVSPSD